MKKIRNVSPDERQIAATGQVVPPNHQVEIEDDALAKSLLEQTDIWERVTAKKETSDG